MKCLRKVESFLQEDDPDKQLPNVKAILSAYRNKTLDWNKLVTYWSKGKQLCQPRRFDWDEFEVVNATHGIDKGFWVEGVGAVHLSMMIDIDAPLLTLSSFMVLAQH